MDFPEAPPQIEVLRLTLENALEQMRNYRKAAQLSLRLQRHLDYLIYRQNSIINNLDQLEREF